jgi:hypothetical protein
LQLFFILSSLFFILSMQTDNQAELSGGTNTLFEQMSLVPSGEGFSSTANEKGTAEAVPFMKAI